MSEKAPRRTFVTIKRAQEIAGVSRRTIYNWLQKGKVPYRRTAGGGVRIDEASLLTVPSTVWDREEDVSPPGSSQ